MDISSSPNLTPVFRGLSLQDTVFKTMFEFDINKPSHPDFIAKVFCEDSQFANSLQMPGVMFIAKMPPANRAAFPLFANACFSYSLLVAVAKVAVGNPEQKTEGFLFLMSSRKNDQLSDMDKDTLARTLEELNQFGAFNQIQLGGLNLTGFNLSKLNLVMVVLDGADLTDADLSETKFYCAFMQRVTMTRTDLTKTSIDGSYMQSSTLDKTILINTTINDTKLNNVVISQCECEGVVISRCEYDDAVFKNTNMDGVTFDSNKKEIK